MEAADQDVTGLDVGTATAVVAISCAVFTAKPISPTIKSGPGAAGMDTLRRLTVARRVPHQNAYLTCPFCEWESEVWDPDAKKQDGTEGAPWGQDSS